MTRLLQFLDGPALNAVQRYEPMPSGLAKALKTLEERFGQPFQVPMDLLYKQMIRTACNAILILPKLPMTPWNQWDTLVR